MADPKGPTLKNWVQEELDKAEKDIREEIEAILPVLRSLHDGVHLPHALPHAKRVLVGASRIATRAATAETLHRILKKK